MNELQLQALFDGMCKHRQRERAASQMTLGKLINRLEGMPKGQKIKGLGELDSYRGYYEDLAFEPADTEKTVEQLLSECRAAMGKVFTGYKGGEYMMGELTPLWVADYGCSGKKLIAINDDGSLKLAEDD
jgi:hypothetical protein